jgi:hypothetical protein
MQILGLSDSTPKPENRFKSLLWPSIRNEIDLDTVTTQGFWICFIVAVISLGLAILSGSSLIIVITCFESAFYILAGMGVRMRSRVAAVAVFTSYLLSGFVLMKYTNQGISIVRLIVLALLLANVRGIWLSASWTAVEGDVAPVRLNETWRDKLADQWPAALWPRLRILFYVLAVLEICGLLVALFPIAQGGGPEV